VIVPEDLSAAERKALSAFVEARTPESEERVKEYLAAVTKLRR
jgi:hypothetical protein